MKKIILSLICGILILGLTAGCCKKEEITNNELTKEEIGNIEKQYYNSETVLNIDSYSRISDRGLVITTNFENPSTHLIKFSNLLTQREKFKRLYLYQ